MSTEPPSDIQVVSATSPSHRPHAHHAANIPPPTPHTNQQAPLWAALEDSPVDCAQITTFACVPASLHTAWCSSFHAAGGSGLRGRPLGQPPSLAFSLDVCVLRSLFCLPPRRPSATACGFFFCGIFLSLLSPRMIAPCATTPRGLVVAPARKVLKTVFADHRVPPSR